MPSFSTITNISEMGGSAALAAASRDMSVAMERLTTGRKINRASDDPAGSVAVDHLKSRLTVIHKRLDGLAFDEHYFGARDGADSALSDLLLDLRGHIVTAANSGGLAPAEKEATQKSAEDIINTIDFLSQTTTFNGSQVLGFFTSQTLGAVSIPDPDHPDQPSRSYTLRDLLASGSLNLVSGDMTDGQKVIDAAVSTVSGDRATVGGQVRDLESQRRTLMSELENTEASRSGIEDADFAAETSNLVRASVLKQAAQYIMQLSRNQQAGTILQLLGAAQH